MADGVIEVRAEFFANVWQIRVAVGDLVEAGDELVVLESMKIEIPVEAPVAGRVVDIRVQEGVPVQERDVIATLAPVEPGR